MKDKNFRLIDNRLEVEKYHQDKFYLDDYDYKCWEDEGLISTITSRFGVSRDQAKLYILRVFGYNRDECIQILAIPSISAYEQRITRINKIIKL